jgi:hypothetical protein
MRNPRRSTRSADGDDEEIVEILDETRSNPTYQEFVGAIDSRAVLR